MKKKWIKGNSNKDDDDKLIELRSARDEILNNLKKGQKELEKASAIYPSQVWSNHQIYRINYLDTSIQIESELLKKF